MRLILVWLAGLFLAGCISPQPKITPPLYNYKADIKITVDGSTFDGMAVTKIGEKDIEINSEAELNYLLIDSCGRETVIQNVKKGWFGGTGKSYTYHFVPTDYETKNACPLYIQALASNGIVAWGYLFWRTEEALPSQVDCNGERWHFKGATVCQTKTGIRQEIFFDKQVRYEPSSLCTIKEDPNNKNAFIVENKANGFCYVTFTDGALIHRLVLLGYDMVLVRDR